MLVHVYKGSTFPLLKCYMKHENTKCREESKNDCPPSLGDNILPLSLYTMDTVDRVLYKYNMSIFPGGRRV